MAIFAAESFWFTPTPTEITVSATKAINENDARHELGADHELINGIGVAPGYYVPLTAQDLSTGHDPDITKALTLLSG